MKGSNLNLLVKESVIRAIFSIAVPTGSTPKRVQNSSGISLGALSECSCG